MQCYHKCEEVQVFHGPSCSKTEVVPLQCMTFLNNFPCCDMDVLDRLVKGKVIVKDCGKCNQLWSQLRLKILV